MHHWTKVNCRFLFKYSFAIFTMGFQMFPILLRQFSSVHNHEIMSWYVKFLLQVWPCAWYGQSKHNMSSASNFLNYSGQNSQIFVHPNFYTSFPTAEVSCFDQGMILKDSGKSSSSSFFFLRSLLNNYTLCVHPNHLKNPHLLPTSNNIWGEPTRLLGSWHPLTTPQ